MDFVEKNISSSYSDGPPWLFKGSALYQLHLVKAETARALIPKEFKLVEAFGYTLGGFFLAHYDDSPAAIFDELVVIAGIIWNPPTSCAWAARVLVNSHEACSHGRKEVGLPSHVGIFSKRDVKTREKPLNKCTRFLDMIGIGSNCVDSKEHSEVHVAESRDSSLMSLCSISLPYVVPHAEEDKKWMGPTIRMSLPSFSGQTIHNPHLLKYCCQIQCRVRTVQAAKISGPIKVNSTKSNDNNKHNDDDSNTTVSAVEEDSNATVSAAEEDAWNRSISVLLSKPILALEFSHLKMQVGAPTIVVPCSTYTASGDSRVR